ILAERAVAHDGDALVVAERHHRMLDGAFGEVMHYLVAADRGHPSYVHELPELHLIEVADAPVSYLAGAYQRLETGDRFGRRVRRQPVQQVDVQVIGTQALQ